MESVIQSCWQCQLPCECLCTIGLGCVNVHGVCASRMRSPKVMIRSIVLRMPLHQWFLDACMCIVCLPLDSVIRNWWVNQVSYKYRCKSGFGCVHVHGLCANGKRHPKLLATIERLRSIVVLLVWGTCMCMVCLVLESVIRSWCHDQVVFECRCTIGFGCVHMHDVVL